MVLRPHRHIRVLRIRCEQMSGPNSAYSQVLQIILHVLVVIDPVSSVVTCVWQRLLERELLLCQNVCHWCCGELCERSKVTKNATPIGTLRLHLLPAPWRCWCQ